jgi:nucleoside-diphosphate-sugar epimerase
MQPTWSAASLAERPLLHAMVLGASGFIGGSLVRVLARADVRVSCLVHRGRPPAVASRALHGSIESFRWRDLESDPPDVIFHLARISGRGGWRGPVTRARNRIANERLLLWLTSCPRPPLLVYVGGSLAYGSHGDCDVSEETPLSPISFSRNYHAAEVPWLRALRDGDVPLVLARPAWVLGPGSWFEAYFRTPMREERTVPLYGNGENWMSLLHVDDCAGLLAHVARRAPLGSTINVFTGAPLTQREFVERLARLARLPIRHVSLDELEARHGGPVREAFAFSARVASVHGSLLAEYRPSYTDLDAALASLL